MMQPVEHAQFAALKEELNFSGHIVRGVFLVYFTYEQKHESPATNPILSHLK
jgi:hypothetical protein